MDFIEDWLRGGLDEALQGALQWSLGHLWQIALVIGVTLIGIALFRANTRQKKAQRMPGGQLARGYCPSCGRSHDGKCWAVR